MICIDWSVPLSTIYYVSILVLNINTYIDPISDYIATNQRKNYLLSEEENSKYLHSHLKNLEYFLILSLRWVCVYLLTLKIVNWDLIFYFYFRYTNVRLIFRNRQIDQSYFKTIYVFKADVGHNVLAFMGSKKGKYIFYYYIILIKRILSSFINCNHHVCYL